MRLLLAEHYRTAVESLRRSRTRTALTILGVAIGIASITAIMALSAGVSQVIGKQLGSITHDIAVIRPAQAEVSVNDLSSPMPNSSYATSPLTERDLELIEKQPGVKSVAPIMTVSGAVQSKKSSAPGATVTATTPSFLDSTSLELEDGGFIDSVTLENTAVIGHKLALQLFDTTQVMGNTFTIKGQRFTVIGVIDLQKSSVNYNNIDIDNTAFISFSSGKLFNQNVAQIQQINVALESGKDQQKIVNNIRTLLKKSHDNQADTVVLAGEEIATPSNQFFKTIETMMTVIAGISLVVGGIGIMNIMLVGVAERTREIGLRKAVGASNGMIITQFLLEALIMSLLGGLIGYAGGYAIAIIGSLALPYSPVFSWHVLGYALCLSVGVGVLFGLYPAARAARKDPIESLRQYH